MRQRSYDLEHKHQAGRQAGRQHVSRNGHQSCVDLPTTIKCKEKKMK